MQEKRKITLQDLVQVEEYLFEIPRSWNPHMLVPARLYMSKDMFADIQEDRSLIQLMNMAWLPGIKKFAFAMPDIHQGYGFPIGGVAATAIHEEGVISPGGIGYDINCGVRLLVAHQTYNDIKKYIGELATALYEIVPSGVGRGGSIKLDQRLLNIILHDGARAAVSMGYGNDTDLLFCEESGCMPGADASLVSDQAKQRGIDQLGTLGSGNHFLEVQRVDKIYDEQVAHTFGLALDQITVMIHCGSRGLGHQVCTDHVRAMMDLIPKFGYTLPDRELVCVPFESAAGKNYFAAMVAASNFAWANRHTIAHLVRQAWQGVFGRHALLHTVYDVSHNIGKREWHMVEGKKIELLLHRKGATRAFGPSRPEVPAPYKKVGQPVLIPGTMGTASYVLVGTDESMDQAFGSSCHGAGRRLSRQKAKQSIRGSQLRKSLERDGIAIRCDSDAGLAEEAPRAYKDVDSVVEVVGQAHLAKKVVRLRPIAVIKGG